MKKVIIALVLMLAALSAFAQNGVMKELTGTVELKNANSTAFVAAKTGDIVNQDTIVSTGFKSTALIEVGSTVITVRPLTRLTLTEIKAASGSESLNVNLQSGRIRVDVNPPAGAKASMAVSSPSATASVRGTSFEFDTRNLHVISGNVIFKGVRGVATLITAGYNSTTDVKGSAVNPLAFGDAAYKPQMPVGTQANASPASIATGNGGETTPTEPGKPTNPTNPTTPTNPNTPNNPGTTNPGTTNPGTTNPGTNNPGTNNPGTNNPSPGSGDGGNTGVDVNFN